MAAAMNQQTVGLSGSSLPLRSSRVQAKKPIAMKSAFTGASARALFTPARVSTPASTRQVTAMAFNQNWIKPDGAVLFLAGLGWTVPSSLPVGAYGDSSLFGAFCERIGANMANFPTGPSIDDPIWLYMISWHIGLFTCMTLGQIGFQGRKQGYW